MIFGGRIKSLREKKQIPQRQVAAALKIDTATYCKIEKGDRRAKREQLVHIGNLLEIDTKELLCLWYADKVYELIAEEDAPADILNIVAETISKKNVN
ncbi:MAG: helix-turn-helix transcriptional regulator [Bacteroidota bacterium]|nr:helix-turn-helix transcriptional regulator [Bacteroidota bacterium]